MRHGIQDDEDTKILSTRAQAIARDHASYRESLCGLCAGSGIPVKRSPDSPQTLDTCGNCLGVGLVWRLTEGEVEHVCNARQVLERASRQR
jgi:hypothetical protein